MIQSRDRSQKQPVEREVELAISGSISVEKPWTRQVQKGLDYWTPVTVSDVPDGVKITLAARAYDQQNPNDVAVYFVGKAMDVLSHRIDLPLHLSLSQLEFKKIAGHVKRRVNKDEWLNSFAAARRYETERPIFLRSLGWYRKGLTSEDPIDSLMAFWSALEGVGSQLHRPSERTKNGIIYQICGCFDQVWGTVES